MDIKTNTTTVYRIEFTDAEIGEIIADPSAFVGELRRHRAGLAARRPNQRQSLTLGKGASRPKAGKTPCRICGKPVTERGQSRHMRQTHPEAA